MIRWISELYYVLARILSAEPTVRDVNDEERYLLSFDALRTAPDFNPHSRSEEKARRRTTDVNELEDAVQDGVQIVELDDQVEPAYLVRFFTSFIEWALQTSRHVGDVPRFEFDLFSFFEDYRANTHGSAVKEEISAFWRSYQHGLLSLLHYLDAEQNMLRIRWGTIDGVRPLGPLDSSGVWDCTLSRFRDVDSGAVISTDPGAHTLWVGLLCEFDHISLRGAHNFLRLQVRYMLVALRDTAAGCDTSIGTQEALEHLFLRLFRKMCAIRPRSKWYINDVPISSDGEWEWNQAIYNFYSEDDSWWNMTFGEPTGLWGLWFCRMWAREFGHALLMMRHASEFFSVDFPEVLDELDLMVFADNRLCDDFMTRTLGLWEQEELADWRSWADALVLVMGSLVAENQSRIWEAVSLDESCKTIIGKPNPW